MAAFLDTRARQAPPMSADACTPLGLLRPAMRPGTHLTRTTLVMKQRVGMGGRCTWTWISEERAAFTDPPD